MLVYLFIFILWGKCGLDDSWFFCSWNSMSLQNTECCSGWAAESAAETMRGFGNKPHGPIEVKAKAAYLNRIKKSLKLGLLCFWSRVPAAVSCFTGHDSASWGPLSPCCLERLLCRTDVFFKLKDSFSLTSLPWHSILRSYSIHHVPLLSHDSCYCLSISIKIAQSVLCIFHKTVLEPPLDVLYNYRIPVFSFIQRLC